MNEATNAENEKRAAKAYARGFLDHAIVGLGLSPEVAGERYKRASTIARNTQTKFEKLATAIREHISSTPEVPAAPAAKA